MEFLKKKNIVKNLLYFTYYMYSNCQLYDYQIEVLGKYMFWTLKLNKIDGYLRSPISSVFSF